MKQTLRITSATASVVALVLGYINAVYFPYYGNIGVTIFMSGILGAIFASLTEFIPRDDEDSTRICRFIATASYTIALTSFLQLCNEHVITLNTLSAALVMIGGLAAITKIVVEVTAAVQSTTQFIGENYLRRRSIS